MGIRWEGIDEFEERLDPKVAMRLASGALYEEGESIMAASKRVTPVKTGALRASGYVTRPIIRSHLASVILGFGQDYAIYVHEGTRNMKGRKYLERPLKAAAKGMDDRIGARMKRRMFK